MKSKEPLSNEELTAVVNKAFEESKYSERITVEEMAPVYAQVSNGYNIDGLRPTSNDANVKSLLSWLPDSKSGKVVIASLDVGYDAGPMSLVPCDVPMCYLIFDFEERVILTEYEAYQKYKKKAKNLA